MASKRRRASGSQQTSGGRTNAKVREHYRAHRVKVDGKWYNPLLDDPNHPDNIRHWTHGTIEGYAQAGCACVPCAAAGRQDTERKEALRLDKRLAEHRARAAVILRGAFDDLPEQAIVDGAELVVSTHHVRQKFNAILTYAQVPVALAVSNWANAHKPDLTPGEATDLATVLTEELNP